MRTRLRLGALTLLSSVLTAVLALAACDAAGRLASAPPSAWGPTALTRTINIAKDKANKFNQLKIHLTATRIANLANLNII